MIPRSYPTLIDGRKAGYMRVFYLTSVTGLTKWIDYIPVKTVAFSSSADGTTNANGHINVVQVASSTALRKWVDYIPVFEDGSATVPWSTNANGYIPVNQMLDLDFRSGILDSRITFTRADAVTCATYFDSTGRMQTAAANVARFDYDPATAAGVTGGELAPAIDTSWTRDASVTVSGSSFVFASTPAASNGAYKAVSLTAGKTYKVTLTTASHTSGTITAWLGGQQGSTSNASLSASGTVTFNVTPAASYNGNFIIGTNTGTTNSVVSLVSIQEVTFTPRGLLIEESRQNLLLQSRDMTQAAWTKTDVTPARTQVGIDGVANTACLMTEGSAGTAATVQNGAAVTAGSTITASVVFKRGNTDWVRIKFTETTGTDGVNAWFNLNTGVKGSTAALGAGTAISSSVVNLGGGWYRCIVTVLPNGTYTVPAIVIQSASADANTTRVANATYIVDCAQLEVGGWASSIIPTTTTSLVRSADSASMTGTNFSSWFNASAGTFVAEFDHPATFIDWRNVVTLEGGAAPLYTLVGANSKVYAGAGANAQTTNTVSQTAVNKVATGYTDSGSTLAVSLNGVTAATGSYTGSVAGNTSIAIGSPSGAWKSINGHIRSLRYYPTRLPNATLQALTA